MLESEKRYYIGGEENEFNGELFMSNQQLPCNGRIYEIQRDGSVKQASVNGSMDTFLVFTNLTIKFQVLGSIGISFDYTFS